MSVRTLRVSLLAVAAVLVAIAAFQFREKKALVDQTTQQIEDTIAALDPAARAAVIARLTADAAREVKDLRTT